MALTLFAVGCSSGSTDEDGRSLVGTPARISHIHGLGVDTSGTLFVATHHGLIKRARDGSFVYAGDDTSDHMGFSLHPGAGIMYRSGHSATRPALGVESSADGARWTHLSDVTDPPADFHAMAVSFADEKALWGWDSGGRGTFRSTDGGVTWARLEPTGIDRQVFVLAGTVARDVVLGGTATGLYRSLDGGATWRAVQGAGDGWVIGIAADPRNSKRIFASTERGLVATDDDGSTWRPAGDGLPAGAELASLAVSPADPDVVYAADSTTIYATDDGGTTWSALPVA